MAASTPNAAKRDQHLGQVLELGEHLVMDGTHADIVVQSVDLLHITGEMVGVDLDEEPFRILGRLADRCARWGRTTGATSSDSAARAIITREMGFMVN
jgi:hypothetical protein